MPPIGISRSKTWWRARAAATPRPLLPSRPPPGTSGLGLASVVNALDPSTVFVGGEITLAWDLIEGAVRSALAERSLTPAAAITDLRTVAPSEHPRLLGAAALVIAPAFAAPVVAWGETS